MIKKYQDKNWLKKKYLKEKLSTHQIGKLCETCHFAISCWLKKYYIPIRSISKAKLGKPSWNKGLTKETDIRLALSEETKINISKAGKGHIAWNKGIPCLEEIKLKISEMNRGKNCNNWKGGITPLTLLIRANFNNRQWISDIFTRDNFTCQMCGDNRGSNLNAHHIKSFSKIIQFYEITTLEEALDCEELWNINNGITLCEECHKKIHKKLCISNKFKKKGSDKKCVL